MVKPTQRKQIVKGLVSAGRQSECTTCEMVGISRTAYRYQGKQAAQDRELEVGVIGEGQAVSALWL